MSPAPEPSRSALSALPTQMERIVNAFEDAWDGGSQPTLDPFLPTPPHEHLPLLIELVHVDLERRLKAGLAARVETYVARYPELARDPKALLDLLAAEYRLRKRHEPDLGLDEYRRRYPQLAPELAGRLLDPAETTRLYQPAAPAGEAGSTLSGGSQPSTRTGPRAGAKDPSLPVIPGYDILDALGRGGMGRVVRARHQVLGRLSAIKVPLSHHLADDDSRERFLREARSAARLSHPHICPIYEVGEADGLPYLVMGLIQGETLRVWAERRPPTPRDAAALVALLARAVGYAHTQGVIHRDIKPANVMVDAKTGQPILMDFGLAKELSGDASQLTHSGQIIGTPAYMAPEQAAGRAEKIGPATDVYALGAVLYELLCGRPPFMGGTAEVLCMVQMDDPVAPRKLVPRLHRDLETICLKALAKEPAARYASAVALAEDLERFTAGEAILARREGAAARLWRAARRHPLTAVSAAVLLLAVGVGAFLLRHYYELRRFEESADRVATTVEAADLTPESVARAEAALAELAARSPEKAAARRKELHSRLAKTVEGLLRRDILRQADKDRIDAGLALLAARAPDLERPLREARARRYKGFDKVFHLSAASTDADLAEVFAPGSLRREGGALVAAEDGRTGDQEKRAATLATRVACQGNVKLRAQLEGPWDALSRVGLTLHASGGHQAMVNDAAFAPDGRMLATASSDGTVGLWDPATGEETAALAVGAEGAWAVRFAPDGKTLASGGSDGKVRIWDVATRAQVAVLDAAPGVVLCLAYSADGKALAAAGTNPNNANPVRVWDVATRRVVFAGQGHREPVRSLAFARDGELLASGGQSGTVRLWDWRAGKEAATLRTDASLLSTVAFSPDGRTLATANSSGKVRLWDVATRQVRAELEAYSAGAYGLCFAPDGKTLAVGYDMGHVKLWDLGREQVRASLPAHGNSVKVVQFSPDGFGLITAATDGGVKLWDADTERVRFFLVGRGYDFLLSGAGPARAADRAGGPLRLSIRRNGVRQRVQSLPVRGGRLLLTATRAGDRLLFQVNELPPVVFRDVLPGGPHGGVFGLRLPAGVRLVSLEGFHQPAPAVQNALDRGDDLFARQRYAEALSWYEQQLRAGVADAEAVREARCKAGLCLMALQQSDRAAELFEEVAAEGGKAGEVWPLIATFQLWLVRVQQGRFADAERLFADVGTRFPRFEEVASVVPEDVRGRILAAYERIAAPRTFLFFDPRGLAPLVRAVQVADRFEAEPARRARLLHRLVWAYGLSGQRAPAAKAAAEALELLDVKAAVDLFGLSEYVWLTRLAHGPERALDELNRRLADAGAGAEQRPLLLVERARLHAVRADWAAAARDLDDLFRLPVSAVPYEHWAAAALLQGFEREQGGDRAGALAAWERGRYLNWPGREALALHADIPGNVVPVIYNLLLGALTGKTTDDEAKATLARLAGALGHESPHLRLLQLNVVPLAVLQQMGQTPRGHAAVRKVALRETSVPEMLRTPVLLVVVEYFHQGALPGALSKDREEVIWQAAETNLDAYSRGAVKLQHLNHLAVAWKGAGEVFGMGWRHVKDALAPPVRGPIAYLLGHRHLARGKRAEALRFFETALRDAPAGSALERLSRADLDRLKKQ